MLRIEVQLNVIVCDELLHFDQTKVANSETWSAYRGVNFEANV